ncbi:hypothetical protein ES705_01467 [subsurface metagenome]|nr:hypothetical protein [Clostridia bacterium]
MVLYTGKITYNDRGEAQFENEIFNTIIDEKRTVVKGEIDLDNEEIKILYDDGQTDRMSYMKNENDL